MSEQTIHLGYGKPSDGNDQGDKKPASEKKLDGYSGRVVRVQTLEPEMLDAIELASAKELSEGGSYAEYLSLVGRAGLDAFVIAYSEPCVPKDRLTVKMTPINAATMNAQRNKIFKAKDLRLLKRIYDREHAVTEKEVDAIMGGAIVSVD